VRRDFLRFLSARHVEFVEIKLEAPTAAQRVNMAVAVGLSAAAKEIPIFVKFRLAAGHPENGRQERDGTDGHAGILQEGDEYEVAGTSHLVRRASHYLHPTSTPEARLEMDRRLW
jgi:hypothetical protein